MAKQDITVPAIYWIFVTFYGINETITIRATFATGGIIMCLIRGLGSGIDLLFFPLDIYQFFILLSLQWQRQQ